MSARAWDRRRNRVRFDIAMRKVVRGETVRFTLMPANVSVIVTLPRKDIK